MEIEKHELIVKIFSKFLSPLPLIINFLQIDYLDINANKKHSDNIFNRTLPSSHLLILRTMAGVIENINFLMKPPSFSSMV